MANEDIQTLIDGLDRQLALSQIDIGTYHQLKAKFVAQQQSTSDPLSDMASAMPREARAIKCPGCSAPLPIPNDSSIMHVVCDYCAGSYELRPAAEEMEALRLDILKQIADIAGNTNLGTTVDEVSRRFIFNEKLLPNLKVTTDRATEFSRAVRYQALFTFPLLELIASSHFSEAIRLTPESEQIDKQIQTSIAMAQAPETTGFATSDIERSKLFDIELRCQELIFVAKARHYVKNFDIDDMSKAKINLHSLGDLYSTAAEKLGPSDPTANVFFVALANRTKSVEHALETLILLVRGADGIMTDQLVTNLESHARTCEQAANEIETAGRELWEQIPATQGSRADAETIRLLATCVRLYGYCGGESGLSFSDFSNGLANILLQSKQSKTDTSWLSEKISVLTAHVSSTAQDSNASVVFDFHNIDDIAPTLVRKPLMGKLESFEIESRVLLPFWVMELSFAEQKGMVFKKGQEMKSLLFLSGYDKNTSFSVAPFDDPISVACYRAIESPIPIGASTPALIPSITSDEADSLSRGFVSTTKQYLGGNLKPLGLIYMSAAICRYYTEKNQRFSTVLPSQNVHINELSTQSLKLGNRELISTSYSEGG